MYKEELALNNLQWLTYHKTQPNQISVLDPSTIISITWEFQAELFIPSLRL